MTSNRDFNYMAFIALTLGIIALGLAVNGLTQDNHTCILDFNVTKQEALICGARQDTFQYVEHYTIDKNYVVDYESGRVFSVWHCSPFDKQMEK